jgi:hypothetical protein
LGIKTIFKEETAFLPLKELFVALDLGSGFKATFGFFDGGRRITTNQFKDLLLKVIAEMAREPLAFAYRERPLHIFQGPAPSVAVEWNKSFDELTIALSGLLSFGPQGKGLLLWIQPDYKADTPSEWLYPKDLGSLIEGGLFYSAGGGLSYELADKVRLGFALQVVGRRFEDGFKEKYDKKAKNDDPIDMLLAEFGAQIKDAAFLASYSQVKDGTKEQDYLYLALRYELLKLNELNLGTQVSYTHLIKSEVGNPDIESYFFGGALLAQLSLANGWKLNAAAGADRFSDPALPAEGLVVPRLSLAGQISF